MKSKYYRKIYVVAESRLSVLPVEKPKKGTPNDVDDKSLNKTNGEKAKTSEVSYEVLEKFQGSSLAGKK